MRCPHYPFPPSPCSSCSCLLSLTAKLIFRINHRSCFRTWLHSSRPVRMVNHKAHRHVRGYWKTRDSSMQGGAKEAFALLKPHQRLPPPKLHQRSPPPPSRDATLIPMLMLMPLMLMPTTLMPMHSLVLRNASRWFTEHVHYSLVVSNVV